MNMYSIKRAITHWAQRKIRGWDDSDLWSLDFTLAKWILPRLTEFKKVKRGVPCLEGFGSYHVDEDYKKAEDEWDRIIDLMILSFELIVRDGNGEILSREEEAKIDEGLDLFKKYLRNLWW